MRLLRQLRAVVWSFIGVRGAADAARDLEGARPATLVLLGVIVAGAVVLAIALLVHVVARGRPSTVAQEPVTTKTQPAPRAVTQPGARVVVADTMEERARPCATCHGSRTEQNRDGFSPRIAGKPAGYLFNQLVSFRDGRRTYPAMVYMVQYMSDEYLRDMARYFSELDLPYPPPEAAALSVADAAHVKQLLEHGDAARQVPACMDCHGPGLAGVDPAIPGLLGLPRHYINAQFGAWRQGRLRSIAPDCMAEVANRLAPEDVPIIAAWLAAQPVPPGMHPERSAAGQLPLACGSVSAAK